MGRALMLSFFAKNLASSCLCLLLRRPSTSPRLSWVSSDGRMRSWWRPICEEESVLLNDFLDFKLGLDKVDEEIVSHGDLVEIGVGP